MSLLTYPCRIWKGKPLLFHQSRGTWQQNHWCTRKRVGFQISLSDLEEWRDSQCSASVLLIRVPVALSVLLLPSPSCVWPLWSIVSLNFKISCDVCSILILNFWGYCHVKEFLEIEELSRLSWFLLEFPLGQLEIIYWNNTLKVHRMMTFLHSKSLLCMIWSEFFFNHSFFLKFILFLAELGLCCCVQAFSNCSKRGLLFVAVHRLLIVVASLVVEHGL